MVASKGGTLFKIKIVKLQFDNNYKTLFTAIYFILSVFVTTTTAT